MIVGDVRVECTPAGGGPFYVDLVQKIHRVSPNLVIGFAGSVKLGFEMVESLRWYANGPAWRHAMTPGRVLLRWQRTARRVWANASTPHRRLGCDLLVVGTYPAVGLIHLSGGWILGARNDFIPQPFSPSQPSRAHHLSGIGSGMESEELRGLLSLTAYEWWLKAKAITGTDAATPDDLGLILKQSIGSSVRNGGVSSHVHIGSLRADKFDLSTNDDPASGWVMPAVATDFPTFKKLAGTHGIPIASARA